MGRFSAKQPLKVTQVIIIIITFYYILLHFSYDGQKQVMMNIPTWRSATADFLLVLVSVANQSSTGHFKLSNHSVAPLPTVSLVDIFRTASNKVPWLLTPAQTVVLRTAKMIETWFSNFLLE